MVIARSLVLLSLGTAIGCPSPPPPVGEDARRAVLVRIVDDIVRPELASFEDESAALVLAAEAHEAAGGVAGPAQDDARAAWRAAMSRWQGLEMIHVGPAGSPASFVGGQGMRDLVYAWPQKNPCGVDQQLVQNVFTTSGWAEDRLVNILGLGAIEYVLFVEGGDNACPSAATINSEGTWAALGAVEVAARRAAYARVIAQDVAAHAEALVDAWQAYGDDLKNAGNKGSSFATAQQGLDDVFAAMFAVELGTKDLRLGIPSGLNAACTTDTCPEALESATSATSRENVEQNLAMMRRLLLGLDDDGRDGKGFDDLLRDHKDGALADAMTTSLDAALTAVRGFQGSFEDALVVDPTPVRDVYEAVKAFTDDFKGAFATALGLHIPEEGAGDND